MRPRGRRPGESQTDDDILRAARALFAERGYERASLRLVAERAGVDPALILHYFGSKEGLLRAALQPPFDPAEVLAGAAVDRGAAGEEYVRRIVTAWEESEPREMLLGALRSALSHPWAMDVLRTMFQRTLIPALGASAQLEQPERRAELVATQMIGLAVMRYVVQLPTVAAMSVDEVAATVGPTIHRYLFGPLPPTNQEA